MPRPAGARRAIVAALLITLALSASVAVPGASGSGFPLLPLQSARTLLGNLTGAELTPGSGGSIGFTVGNPLLGPLTGAEVTLGVYAFNAFPGNSTSTVPVSSPPLLSNGSVDAAQVNVTLGTINPGQVRAGTVSVASSTLTPSGTFAVRTAVRFVANGTSYLLESRGWFTAATWTAATNGPNGTVVLNLTALGVSGVVPETSILVSSSSVTWALWALAGTALGVLAVGGYLYARRPKSSAGARHPPEESHAPNALGASRTSDGD